MKYCVDTSVKISLISGIILPVKPDYLDHSQTTCNALQTAVSGYLQWSARIFAPDSWLQLFELFFLLKDSGKQLTLPLFTPMSHFYTPFYTFGFLTFSGGKEMEHWREKD